MMSNETEKPNSQNRELPEITSADFIPEVLASKQPVLVEFWTSWSRPCEILDSVLQELATDYAGTVKAVRVNADNCLDISLAYEIQCVPTLICFVGGNPRWTIVGTATKDAIQAKLDGLSK
jgi:thioredoxin 1